MGRKLYALIALQVALSAEWLLLLFLLHRLPRVDFGLAPAGALLVNLGLILQFALGHSLMARPGFKRWWTQYIPAPLERSTYLAVAGLSLGLLLILWQPLPGSVWNLTSPVGVAALHAGLALGLGLLFWAVLSLDPWGFHGLRQVWRPGSGDPPFSRRGPYRYLRHPIQSGLLLALWSTPLLTADRLLFNAVLTLYCVLATLRLEERDLLEALGPDYARYQREVGAFWPRLRRPPSADGFGP